MGPILGAAMSVVLGVLCAIALRRAHPEVTVETAHRLRPGIPVTILAAAVILALQVAAAVHDPLAADLPLWLQRHLEVLTWSLILVLLGFVGALTCTLALLTSHPKWGRLTCCVVAMTGSLSLTAWYATDPIASKLIDYRRGEVILQSSPWSCAAACVANVARVRGLELTEQDAALLMGTTRFGTSTGQMRFGLTELGIPFSSLRGGSLKSLRAPAILFVDHPATGTESHAVLLRSMSSDQFEIWDPLAGPISYSGEELNTGWHGSALLIDCLGAADSRAILPGSGRP